MVGTHQSEEPHSMLYALMLSHSAGARGKCTLCNVEQGRRVVRYEVHRRSRQLRDEHWRVGHCEREPDLPVEYQSSPSAGCSAAYSS